MVWQYGVWWSAVSGPVGRRVYGGGGCSECWDRRLQRGVETGVFQVAVLFCAVLYYAVLCCAVLCCAVLCCAGRLARWAAMRAGWVLARQRAVPAVSRPRACAGPGKQVINGDGGGGGGVVSSLAGRHIPENAQQRAALAKAPKHQNTRGPPAATPPGCHEPCRSPTTPTCGTPRTLAASPLSLQRPRPPPLTRACSKHVLNAQVSIRSPCCKKWFDCAVCHQETADHPLLQSFEMIFICKKCKKAFRKDAREFEDRYA